MPHDVTMPQLGMAQDAGRLVAWLKAPGEPVARGDVLFEVETDKSTMEVEAQADGYLTGVSAAEGDDVPVGQVIARISDSPEAASSEAASSEEPAGADEPAGDSGDVGDGGNGGDELPDGAVVTMPQLGMAQDTGLLIAWHCAPGDRVAADDVLFEVETDKSAMEVPADRDGFLAATLAQAGEEVPVGAPVAIISATAPGNPIARPLDRAATPSDNASTGAQEAPPATVAAEKPTAMQTGTRVAPTVDGRILASPKARRQALEEGLDLSRLARAGHPQPYHVKDLATLRALPDEAAPGPATMAASRHLTAELPREAFSDFAAWAAENAGLTDEAALLACLAGGCLGGDEAIVAHEACGRRRLYLVPAGPLGGATEVEDGDPDIVLRDLRLTRVSGLRLGAEAAPTLTLMAFGEGLSLTLECAADQLTAADALALVSDFAGRLEQPLRHLL